MRKFLSLNIITLIILFSIFSCEKERNNPLDPKAINYQSPQEENQSSLVGKWYRASENMTLFLNSDNTYLTLTNGINSRKGTYEVNEPAQLVTVYPRQEWKNNSWQDMANYTNITITYLLYQNNNRLALGDYIRISGISSLKGTWYDYYREWNQYYEKVSIMTQYFTSTSNNVKYYTNGVLVGELKFNVYNYDNNLIKRGIIFSTNFIVVTNWWNTNALFMLDDNHFLELEDKSTSLDENVFVRE